LLGIGGQAGVLDFGKLGLGSLIGISFEAEAKGSVGRISDDTVQLKAEITIAFSICVAVFFEISSEIETEYKEDLPLLVAIGLGAALAANGVPVLVL